MPMPPPMLKNPMPCRPERGRQRPPCDRLPNGPTVVTASRCICTPQMQVHSLRSGVHAFHGLIRIPNLFSMCRSTLACVWASTPLTHRHGRVWSRQPHAGYVRARFALGVEAVDTLPQGELDLLGGLATPANTRSGTAGGDHSRVRRRQHVEAQPRAKVPSTARFELASPRNR
jgi:hypothetical protein